MHVEERVLTDRLNSSVKKLQKWSENWHEYYYVRSRNAATCRFLERVDRDNARQMINFESVSHKQNRSAFQYDRQEEGYVGHARYAFSFPVTEVLYQRSSHSSREFDRKLTSRDLVVLDISSRTILAIVE